MLTSLITSKTRVKLLLRLFLNAQSKSYLRQMEKEFGDNTNAIRVELNRFEDAGLINGEYIGSRKYFKANRKHPLYGEINNILKKFVGIDQIIERITSHIGELETAYLTGSFAAGLDSDVIELLLIGQNLDDNYINSLVAKAEGLIERKISYLVLSASQMKDFFSNKPVLLIWKRDEMNLVGDAKK
jgi:hypothetical protein